MKRYCVTQDRIQKKICITTGGFFGHRTIQTFGQNEYQAALEHVKQLAAKNRPSRVSILDGQGNVRRQWEYKERTVPYPYETDPRKKK